jgi:hypothetical protein
MPLTALGGSTGTVTVGDVSLGLFPQPLHPNVMAYVAAVTANGYSPSRSRVDALNNLVWSLVGEELWDLCQVIYPFLGGTTGAAHKWNLKNVADTDAAFRINWVIGGLGVITYSESGVQMTTTTNTTYGNTFYTPSANAVNTANVHLSAYLNIAPSVNGTAIMGALTGSGAQSYQMGRISIGTNPIYGAPNINNNAVLQAQVNTAAFYCAVRNSSNSSTFYRNAISVASSSTGVGAPTNSVYLLNRNGSTAASNGRLAFVSMGAGMTAQQALDFYNIVQAYQTALGRQVV